MFRNFSLQGCLRNVLVSLRRGSAVEGPAWQHPVATAEDAQVISPHLASYVTISYHRRAYKRAACIPSGQPGAGDRQRFAGQVVAELGADALGLAPWGLGGLGSRFCGGQGLRFYTRSSRPWADDPGSARDLRELQHIVERNAQRWARDGNIPVLVTAFSKVGKLPAGANRDGSRGAEDSPSADELRRSIMHTLAAVYLPLVPRLRDPKHCTVPLWAAAKADYWGREAGELPLAEQLLERLEQGGFEMVYRASGQSHSHLWWAMSVAPEEIAIRWLELLAASATRLVEMAAEDIGPQACSNILLACARLLPFMNPGDVAPLMHHLTECLVQLLGEADAQAVANAWYALGRLHERRGHTPLPEHLHSLASSVVQRLRQQAGRAHADSFILQHVSNMLWSCAKLRYPHSELLTGLAEAAGEAAWRMEEQALSNSVWALGRLVEAGCLDGSSGVPGVERLAAVAKQMARQPYRTFTTQGISNLLLGLAHLQSAAQPGTYRLAGAVEALAAEYRQHRRFQESNAQDLANTAWALAKLEHGNHSWYASCVAAALQPGFAKTAVSQNWFNLWWALAHVRHFPANPMLLSRTADAMVSLRQQADAQVCANTLWAVATLGLYDTRLVGCLLGRLVELLPREAVATQHLTTPLWALAVMGPAALSVHVVQVQALLRGLVTRWCGSSGRASFSEGHLQQLFQVQLELEAHPSAEVRSLAAVLQGAGGAGPSIMAAMVRAAKDSPSADPMTRRVCREVAAELQRMQQRQQQQRSVGSGGDGSGGGGGQVGQLSTILGVSEGKLVEGSCRWADVEVQLEGGRAVAVMVDGPRRMLANTPQMRDGHTQLRDRQLRRVYGEGNVVAVSAVEWEALGGDLGRQEQLLRGLLGQPVAAGAEQQGGEQQGSTGEQTQQLQRQLPPGSSVTPAVAVRGGLSGPTGSRPGAASAPTSPRPPSVQELVRQRLQLVAPKAKGRKRAKPSKPS